MTDWTHEKSPVTAQPLHREEIKKLRNIAQINAGSQAAAITHFANPAQRRVKNHPMNRSQSVITLSDLTVWATTVLLGTDQDGPCTRSSARRPIPRDNFPVALSHCACRA